MEPVIRREVGVEAAPGEYGERVLTSEALDFVGALHREFEDRRRALLARRRERRAEFAAGVLPDFPSDGTEARRGTWKVAPAPADLQDRRVEITGPADRKMMINALNSGARVFMVDLEDALSPNWSNVVGGQAHIQDAVRGTLEYTSPDGRVYRLNERVATLVVRPRGWHLEERHVRIDGAPVSASLFDFGLFFHHNARALLERGSGPYVYLPKLESGEEAALWNDVFVFSQDALGIPQGSIRATVLIETILAALEMEEILYALRDYAAGLNAGRWDYIFSVIKNFSARPDFVLPDRAQVTMEVPFMRSYTELLVRTCHSRGAHAIGGMAAFIPSRRDPAVNAVAIEKVRADKEREAWDGFDGTWVAHPDLVPVAEAEFTRVLGDRPHQKDRLREDVTVEAADLLDVRVPGGRVTAEGVRANVRVAIAYMASWLEGRGAVAIDNLMEDAATAEIARAQLWQWHHHGVEVEGMGRLDRASYEAVRDRELTRLVEEGGDPERHRQAAALLDALVLGEEFAEFLTLGAYQYLS